LVGSRLEFLGWTPVNVKLLLPPRQSRGISSPFSGLVNNDAGDLQKRVNESLAKLKGQPLESSAPDTAKAPAAAVQASLAIDSTPAGADIEIDESFVGNTPSAVSVTPGSHKVVVKKKGFADWSKTLNVSGGTIHLNAELEPAVSK